MSHCQLSAKSSILQSHFQFIKFQKSHQLFAIWWAFTKKTATAANHYWMILSLSFSNVVYSLWSCTRKRNHQNSTGKEESSGCSIDSISSIIKGTWLSHLPSLQLSELLWFVFAISDFDVPLGQKSRMIGLPLLR